MSMTGIGGANSDLYNLLIQQAGIGNYTPPQQQQHQYGGYPTGGGDSNSLLLLLLTQLIQQRNGGGGNYQPQPSQLLGTDKLSGDDQRVDWDAEDDTVFHLSDLEDSKVRIDMGDGGDDLIRLQNVEDSQVLVRDFGPEDQLQLFGSADEWMIVNEQDGFITLEHEGEDVELRLRLEDWGGENFVNNIEFLGG